MVIETTININIDTKFRLVNAASKCGISVSSLIVKLMKRALKRPDYMARSFTRIQYQKRVPQQERRRLHLTLIARDYEYFLDMRKIYKRSVSLLVAICTDTHLDTLLNEVHSDKYDEDADNYPFENYLMIQETCGPISCWKIYWGIPENLETILRI